MAGTEETVYRERVYCYELYHQLRNHLGDEFPYKLAGEIDKYGHPIIHKELGPKKPDFIVHVPQKMDKNLVVMEVKSITGIRNIQELKDDINTLIGFLERAEYFRGIMLIYGDGPDEVKRRIISDFRSLANNYKDELLLLWHYKCGEKVAIV